ncbi:MAG: NAD-dependent epimerase/dehydratase family protein [Candidatus Aureabacteria bacterium]|nr:NAD-dependent epimerase/dehydratase family protein [Candidatus Auribacterota bacterium]
MDKIIKGYKDKVILVTGGAGCIGGNLVKRLSQIGAKEVIIIDDLSSSYNWNIPVADNISFIRGDILDEEILKKAFKKEPAYVFHLAAHFANQNSVDNPEKDLMVNGMGTLKVLEYAQSIGVDRFVYASSGCGVYGLESKLPFQEHDISIKLHTPYQITKLLGELYTNFFQNLYKVPIVNARFFNVFGPGEVPGKYRNVIPNFMFWAMQGKQLPITGDGTETRDWTFVEDIINGLLSMGIRKEAIGESINLGSGKETRVIDMANMVNDITNNKSGIVFVERRNWDVKTRLLSSIDKAKKLIEYNPNTSFNDGIKRVHEWFADNFENIKKSADF